MHDRRHQVVRPGHVCDWHTRTRLHEVHAADANQIAHALADKMCSGRELCDRTGQPHLSWAPTVRGGTIQAYATDGEAEYPMGLCTTVGDAMVIRRAAASAPPPEIEFTEVFAGPRAVLSAGVAQRLAAGSAASSASSSSAPSA